MPFNSILPSYVVVILFLPSSFKPFPMACVWESFAGKLIENTIKCRGFWIRIRLLSAIKKFIENHWSEEVKKKYARSLLYFLYRLPPIFVMAYTTRETCTWMIFYSIWIWLDLHRVQTVVFFLFSNLNVELIPA